MILPFANPSGFDRIERNEIEELDEVDPNRDFPYNIDEKFGCLNTYTAKVIDKIFQTNMIIGAISFHGGFNTIAYPWGNFAHKGDP